MRRQIPEEYEAQRLKLKKKNLIFENQYEVEFEIGNHHIDLQKFSMSKDGYPINNQFTCFFRLKDPKEHQFKIGDIIDSVEFTADKWFK